MPHFTTTSLVEVSHNGLRPLPRRLHLTSTHLLVQRPTETDADSTAPVHGSDTEEEFECGEEKRRVLLERQESGQLGMSVKGGWEHGLPLIVTRVTGEGARGRVKRGDALLEINGHRLRRLTHDDCLQLLNSAGPRVELIVKYYPNTRPYLQCEDEEYETERAVPLTFAILTRYLKSTDQLRVRSFQVTDSTLNTTTGVIYPPTTHSLTHWIKSISDTIATLNAHQLKSLSTNVLQIHYCNWVWVGVQAAEWIEWSPRVLTITNDYVQLAEYPPLVVQEEGVRVPVTCSLLRVLTGSECLDEKQHCFLLQMALEGRPFPPKKPASYYCSTETRIELMRVEGGWGRAVVEGVKGRKSTTFPVWWSGKPCALELSTAPTSQFTLYRATTSPCPSTPLWSHHFSQLSSSTDDSRSKLTLKFRGGETETMECSELHRLLFSIHSWLLARVVAV